jgi:DNA-binding MarR family transcriptional regulator
MMQTVTVRQKSSSSEVVDELLAVSRVLIALSARSLSETGEDITLTQYRALVFLATGGACRTSDLAEELSIMPSTATRLCDRLSRKNLIRRYRRSDDRRATWVVLAEDGRSIVGEVMRRRRASLQRLVRDIPRSHHTSLVAGLRGLIEAAGEPGEDEWWRRWRASTKPDPLTVDA